MQLNRWLTIISLHVLTNIKTKCEVLISEDPFMWKLQAINSEFSGTEWYSAFIWTGSRERHRAGRRSELRLREQQCRAAPGLWRRDLCQTRRRKGARRQQQQIQYIFWLHSVSRLRTSASFHTDCSWISSLRATLHCHSCLYSVAGNIRIIWTQRLCENLLSEFVPFCLMMSCVWL